MIVSRLVKGSENGPRSVRAREGRALYNCCYGGRPPALPGRNTGPVCDFAIVRTIGGLGFRPT